MPSLILKSKGTVIQRVLLDPGKTLTIGVSPDNDLIIDDPAVSGRHAEIEPEGERFYITDRQSRNGTFINDELIISRALAQGDVISMGEHVLEFTYDKGEKVPVETDGEDGRKTMTLDTHQHRSKLARSVSRLADDQQRKQRVAVLSYMDDSDRRFLIDKFPLKIGKAPQNDIQIKGFGVAKTAAIIDFMGGEYRLKAHGGLNRPKVNYQTVKGSVALREFDVIEIGSTQLQFHFQNATTPGSDSP